MRQFALFPFSFWLNNKNMKFNKFRCNLLSPHKTFHNCYFFRFFYSSTLCKLYSTYYSSFLFLNIFQSKPSSEFAYFQHRIFDPFKQFCDGIFWNWLEASLSWNFNAQFMKIPVWEKFMQNFSIQFSFKLNVFLGSSLFVTRFQCTKHHKSSTIPWKSWRLQYHKRRL